MGAKEDARPKPSIGGGAKVRAPGFLKPRKILAMWHDPAGESMCAIEGLWGVFSVTSLAFIERATPRLYKRVLSIMRQGGATGMQRNVLTRRTRWLTVQQRATISQSMIESGDVTEQTKFNTGAGRPKTVYFAR